MSQVDSKYSSKRARTDGSRREDDWTCPTCGNVNFSFRTTCNMRNCNQSRPTDHNMKFGAKTGQGPVGYPYGTPYMGSGVPSMYTGLPSHGSSMFGGSFPSYESPFSGGSDYPYRYGSRLGAGAPYGTMSFSGSPYSGGSMMANGGMYGMSSMLTPYGMGMPVGHPASGGRPGYFSDNGPQRKDGGREDDWTCPKCGNLNFAFRTVCNMRSCETPRPDTQGSKAEKKPKPGMPEGSWKCPKCGNINYPFRTVCNRQSCDAEKPSENQPSSPEKHEQ